MNQSINHALHEGGAYMFVQQELKVIVENEVRSYWTMNGKMVDGYVFRSFILWQP
jgi:hypothetical protein